METWQCDKIIIRCCYSKHRAVESWIRISQCLSPCPSNSVHLWIQARAAQSNLCRGKQEASKEIPLPSGLRKDKHRQCWIYLGTLHSLGAGWQPAACWCPSAQSLRTWGSSLLSGCGHNPWRHSGCRRTCSYPASTTPTDKENPPATQTRKKACADWQAFVHRVAILWVHKDAR